MAWSIQTTCGEIMKILSRFLVEIVVLGSGITVSLMLVFAKPKPQMNQAYSSVREHKVEVLYADVVDAPMTVRSQGVVEPRRTLSIVAEVSGKIAFSNSAFIEGGTFSDEEILLELEPSDYENKVLQASAELADVKKDLAIERGVAEQAEKQWRDIGNSKANNLFLRKHHISALEAELAYAESNLAQAKRNLERTKIRLPFVADITRTYVELGQYVKQGEILADVVDSASLIIRVPIPDTQIHLLNVRRGQNGEVEVMHYAEVKGYIGDTRYSWRGHIKRFSPVIDSDTNQYYAIVEIPKHELDQTAYSPKPGLYVDVDIEGKLFTDIVKLPKHAVHDDQKIFLVGAENKVITKSVDVIHEEEKHIWISGNVHQDSPIIVSKRNSLIPGMEVVYEERVGEAANIAESTGSTGKLPRS